MNREIEKKIYDIHLAFLNEYSKASIGLTEFYKAITSFLSSMACGLETQPTEELEENIRSIQDVCFFLKTFCSEIELHTQLLNSKVKSDIDPEVIAELNDDVDTEYEVPENPNEIFPVEVYPEIFTYKSLDPSKFVAGDKGEFFISFIKDDASFLFFMMPNSCADAVIQQPEFRYDIIPSKGTVFGVQLDGVIFRAVRENILPKQKTFKVLLIDVGEIVEITKDYKMFRLTEDRQQTPGQMIYCKLSMNDDNVNLEEDYLRDKLFTKQTVRIDRVYKNMLEVTVLQQPKPTASATVPQVPRPIVKASSNSNSSTSFPAQNLNLNPLSNALALAPKSTKNVTQKTERSGTVNGNDLLTQEELDELYEEPLNTENAMVAVMGYNPQDDRRICKFTDSKTNACFKGSHCKLEHTTKLKDGWTKDQRIFKSTIHAQLPMPKVGKKIQLFIQYVDDIDKFYGQRVPKTCKDADDLPSEHIFKKLNAPEMTAKFKKFTVPPAEFELVFALFDGEWYRARILRKFSDMEYKVFFVDYGNCQTNHIDNIRKWEEAFDSDPFQAIECKLDNITKLKSRDEKAISTFESIVFRKTVTATVTCNARILLVLLEYQGYDVGEQLIAAQFAKPKPITQFHDGMYPG